MLGRHISEAGEDRHRVMIKVTFLGEIRHWKCIFVYIK